MRKVIVVLIMLILFTLSADTVLAYPYFPSAVRNIVRSVDLVIKGSFVLASACFVLAGMEYGRNKIQKKDVLSLERSLLIISLGICLAIILLFLWTFVGNFL